MQPSTVGAQKQKRNPEFPSVNTQQQWFPMVSKWCEMDFATIHRAESNHPVASPDPWSPLFLFGEQVLAKDEVCKLLLAHAEIKEARWRSKHWVSRYRDT